MRGHEVIKVQATSHIEIYQARYVDRKMVRAHVRTLKPAFTEQGEAFTPGGIMPATVAIPPGRSMAKAASTVDLRPIASMA